MDSRTCMHCLTSSEQMVAVVEVSKTDLWHYASLYFFRMVNFELIIWKLATHCACLTRHTRDLTTLDITTMG